MDREHQQPLSGSAWRRIRPALPVVAGLVVFAAALGVLRAELRAVSWAGITGDLMRTRPLALAAALALTVLNYGALAGYDLLAFVHVGRRLPRRRIALASFLAYAISNNVGFAVISGTSVRYRFYTRWGVAADELARVVVSYSITFWLGLLGLGGLGLVAGHYSGAAGPLSGGWVAALGAVLALVPPAYVAASAWRRRPVRVRHVDFSLPSPSLAVCQVLLSTTEWALAGAVLYALLPAGSVPFPVFLGAFLIAALLGMASHVPGGVGVFESLMIVLLAPYADSAQLVPALVVYRGVYYLLPLSVALLLLVSDEVRQRRAYAARVTSAVGRLADELAPRVLATMTFVAGSILLFSGATPAAEGRLEVLGRLVPLGVVEASHFAGSLAGAALLVLSQGLARRLDGAFYAAALAIVAGVGASLLKGLDFEEAAVLIVILAVLWRARPAFDRRAAFFDTRFSAGWIAAIGCALGASLWLGFFAFKHVDYSHELWWQFEIRGEASRFLRASVGAAVVLWLFGLSRLLGFAPHEAPPPSDGELADAGAIIAAEDATGANLVYLRDKSLLFNDDRTAFLMYAVQGRTWVAMGDPVGHEDHATDLIRRFLARCDDFGGVPVFYQVGKAHLHRYADVGLTFVKLGEEASVDLTAFTLEGPPAAKHRQAIRRLTKDGGAFRVVPPAEVPAIVGELQAVSDDWLATKSAAEKGFSLGFFDPAYVARFPVAVIERGGRIEAFANIWAGSRGGELSVDLMRHRHDASKTVMEMMFAHLLAWGKAQGYRRFALGMAPLSGFETSPTAGLWNRLGTFLYRHGESAYNFRGLRAFKDKFDPAWEPRYLAYPGGLTLPRILADVSALIAGGYRRIFRKGPAARPVPPGPASVLEVDPEPLGHPIQGPPIHA